MKLYLYLLIILIWAIIGTAEYIQDRFLQPSFARDNDYKIKVTEGMKKAFKKNGPLYQYDLDPDGPLRTKYCSPKTKGGCDRFPWLRLPYKGEKRNDVAGKKKEEEAFR